MRNRCCLIAALVICVPGCGQDFSKYFHPSSNKASSNQYSVQWNPKVPPYGIGPPADSLTNRRWYQSKAFRVSVAPAALLTSSALTWGIRSDIREIRNRFIPTFEDHFDDVTQFIPGLSVYALNAAGIKGKHSVKRATISMLIGGGISAVLVTALKYTTNVVRPDGSTNNSFPSGHTASAVVSATFLHKEYGQYRDPLYSVGGYAFAAATGIGRQLNNRHWISDVLAGAAIGLISTEIGYLIADKIYGDRGLNAPLDRSGFDRERMRPSFFMAKLGYASTRRDIADQNDNLTAEKGYTMGLEGAYFFNKNFGVGVEMTFAVFPISSNNFSSGDPEIDNNTSEFVTEAMGSRSVYFGPYFSLPIGQWFAVTKFTLGPAFGARGGIISVLTPEAQEETGETEIPIYTYKPETTLGWATNIALRRMIGRNLAINAFAEFNYQKPDVVYSEVDYINSEYVPGTTITTEKSDLSFFSFGLSVSALIW